MNIAHGYAKELLVVSVLLAWLASPNAALLPTRILSQLRLG